MTTIGIPGFGLPVERKKTRMKRSILDVDMTGYLHEIP